MLGLDLAAWQFVLFCIMHLALNEHMHQWLRMRFVCIRIFARADLLTPGSLASVTCASDTQG